MEHPNSNYRPDERKARRILVTGPPLNGRDDYLRQISKSPGTSISYFHVFEEMKREAPKFGLSNLTRENVLSAVSQETLNDIRNAAFASIQKRFRGKNEIQIVSTPARFRIRPSPTASSGRIDGISEHHVRELRPDLVVILIADLLDVRDNLERDDLWRQRVDLSLKTLAEWRRESVELVDDFRNSYLSEKGTPLDTLIFGKGHDVDTFRDLVIGRKPRIYLSYHITGMPESQLIRVQMIKQKLAEHFTCIDPYAIRDWELIEAYDTALEKGSENVWIPYANRSLDVGEVHDAIDEIRAQTVARDYSLVEGTHATVVVHLTEQASYGVMSEIIHARTKADNPVYVLYPFRKRPSPFFEFYVDTERIIQNPDIDTGIASLIQRMLTDIRSNGWPKWETTRS